MMSVESSLESMMTDRYLLITGLFVLLTNPAVQSTSDIMFRHIVRGRSTVRELDKQYSDLSFSSFPYCHSQLHEETTDNCGPSDGFTLHNAIA